MKQPTSTLGMHHVALFVENYAACEAFYVDLIGMQVEWRPDTDNVYLSSGSDNLALHRMAGDYSGRQHLDHIGFFVATPEQVDEWFAFLLARDIRMKTEPRTHRDGARSFYCLDPDGNSVQIIFHPPFVRNIG